MQNAKYIRLYTDESGESHFEDLEVELSPVDFAPRPLPSIWPHFYQSPKVSGLARLRAGEANRFIPPHVARYFVP